jgi:hypothetical protein
MPEAAATVVGSLGEAGAPGRRPAPELWRNGSSIVFAADSTLLCKQAPLRGEHLLGIREGTQGNFIPIDINDDDDEEEEKRPDAVEADSKAQLTVDALTPL